MSRIQEDTKPLLLSFLSGWPDLNSNDQTLLARWATMFTMVVDFNIPKQQAISQKERTKFRTTKQPLDEWSIWAARFTGREWHTGFWHNPLGPIHDMADMNPTQCDTQITTFAFGHLLLQTFSTTNPFVKEMLPVEHAKSLEVRRIWPVTQAVVTRPTRFFSDRGFEPFATLIARGIVKRVINPW